MASPYTGVPANITAPLVATINGATNASPIVISTTSAHLYATNDVIEVAGVTGNTAANGIWKITVTDPTHFQLVGSTGSGAYVSGGTATNRSLTPQFNIPSDGDPPTAASVNVAFQALADRTQYLGLALSPLTDIATLKTINTTGMTDGTSRHVKGHGYFTFDSGSAATENLPWVVQPNTGSGRWISGTAHQASVTRNVSCDSVQGVGSVAGAVDGIDTTSLDFQVIPITVALVFLSAGSMYPAAVYGGAGSGKRRRYVIPLNDAMIDGATLSSAVLKFTTFVTHAGVPAELPQFAIFRRALASTGLAGYGAASTLLSTGNGYATLATPANVAAYEVENTITLTPDQNNVIDRSTYRYFAVIGDEARTNATANSNAYQTISLSFASLPDARRS